MSEHPYRLGAVPEPLAGGGALRGRVPAWWRALVASPVFPGDEDRTQQARLFTLCYFFSTGWLVLTMMGNIGGRQIHGLINWLTFAALLLGLVPYLWVRSGRLESGAAIWLAHAFFMATLGLVLLGTIRAPALGFYLILVICSGLLFGARAMVSMAVMCSLTVAGLIVAENKGWLPVPDYRVTVTQWVTSTALFACMGGLTLLAMQQTRRALVRAQREVAERRRTEAELRETNRKLEEALHSVKTLKGLLPVCAWCRKVREDEGYWSALENYIMAHTDATITHGICPDCRKKYFGTTAGSRPPPPG